LEERADDLDRKVRSAGEKAGEDRITAERKVTSAEKQALEAERRAEASEARAAEAQHQVELLLGIITEELGSVKGAPR
jgi:hypothetical protein